MRANKQRLNEFRSSIRLSPPRLLTQCDRGEEDQAGGISIPKEEEEGNFGSVGEGARDGGNRLKANPTWYGKTNACVAFYKGVCV